jgi:hypothetical protein
MEAAKCYLCGQSLGAGEARTVPIAVSFTAAFRFLAENAPDADDIATRRDLLRSVRESASPRGAMETPTTVCPDCSNILS